MELADALAAYRNRTAPRVLEVISAAAGRAPQLDRRLAEAGIDPVTAGLDDLDAMPVLSKDALPALQQEHPPLGELLSGDADVVRLFASPGPIYEAQLAGPDPWRWGPALVACGIGAGDVVLNCFSYHLSPAGAMFDEACRAVGAVVVPAGVGGTDVQAQVVAALGVTGYVGLPSYLAALAEKYDAAGLDPARWRVTKALVTAEPLPDPLRAQLQQRVATVLMAYGTAECGLIGYETDPGAGLAVPPTVYVEICDPATGRPLDPGALGQVVVTVLDETYPLVRFGTGDVSRWVAGDDGEPRLAGVLGRVGAAVKVRGMFVHPHQAGQVLASLRPAGAEQGRFVVSRDGGRDRLRLELVAAVGCDRDGLVDAAVARSRDVLRVRPDVALVDTVEEGVLVDTREWS